jgi:hypothetical protein
LKTAEHPEESTPSTMPGSAVINGKLFATAVFIFLLALTIITYYGVPLLVIPFFQQRPPKAHAALHAVDLAIRAYHADHGAFPPTDDVWRYRRPNKNVMKSKAFGISTYLGSAMTTPVAYLNPLRVGDPYAMPEQAAPPGFFVAELPQGPVAVVHSAGPNLRFDIRSVNGQGHEDRAALVAYLERHSYDPTNGARSSGDIFRLIDPAEPPAAPAHLLPPPGSPTAAE